MRTKAIAVRASRSDGKTIQALPECEKMISDTNNRQSKILLCHPVVIALIIPEILSGSSAPCKSFEGNSESRLTNESQHSEQINCLQCRLFGKFGSGGSEEVGRACKPWGWARWACGGGGRLR